MEWRPSRWLLIALLALAALAALATLASEMPRPAAWPLAAVALAYGGWLARSEWRRPRRELVFPVGDGPVLVDGCQVRGLVVHWRGPLACLRWRDGDGRHHRLVWWPDTLPPAARRELRLAAPAGEAARGRRSMAP